MVAFLCLLFDDEFVARKIDLKKVGNAYCSTL